MDKKLKELGRKLEGIRKIHGHTRYELAKLLDVKFDTIKKLEETGKANICTLFKVCAYYGVEVSLLQKAFSKS